MPDGCLLIGKGLNEYGRAPYSILFSEVLEREEYPEGSRRVLQKLEVYACVSKRYRRYSRGK